MPNLSWSNRAGSSLLMLHRQGSRNVSFGGHFRVGSGFYPAQPATPTERLPGTAGIMSGADRSGLARVQHASGTLLGQSWYLQIGAPAFGTVSWRSQ